MWTVSGWTSVITSYSIHYTKLYEGNYIYGYKNVDDTFNTSGIEFTGDFEFSSAIKMKSNVTYTHVDKDLNLRIPKFKGNASILYDVSKRTFMSLSYQYNDSRSDAFFNDVTYTTDQITLKSYSLLDFYVSHKLINNKVMFFANITNILNEDYQELYGYSTLGRNVSLGLNIAL